MANHFRTSEPDEHAQTLADGMDRAQETSAMDPSADVLMSAPRSDARAEAQVSQSNETQMHQQTEVPTPQMSLSDDMHFSQEDMTPRVSAEPLGKVSSVEGMGTIDDVDDMDVLQNVSPLDIAQTEQHTSSSAHTVDTVSVSSMPSASQTDTRDAGSRATVSASEVFVQGYAGLAHDDEPERPHTGKPTISLRDVSMVYPAQPDKPALTHVSLDIYPGEFAFVVGHSGSGKSTLLRLLTRELKATHGQVIVAGQDLCQMRNWKIPYLRRQIGTVYQDFKLLPDKTVYENVAFALECIGKPRSVIKAQVPEVLRLVGLAEKMTHYPDQLSGGEQQRVSVARAMVNRPPLLVCDEPTGNLDPAISLGIMKLLDRINRTGTTIVMATHDREMVDSMRKRVIALEAGSIVRDQEKGGYGYYGAL